MLQTLTYTLALVLPDAISFGKSARLRYWKSPVKKLLSCKTGCSNISFLYGNIHR